MIQTLLPDPQLQEEYMILIERPFLVQSTALDLSEYTKVNLSTICLDTL